MKVRLGIITMIVVAVATMVSCAGGGKYADVKQEISKMSASVDKFDVALDKVTDSAGAIAAINQLVSDMKVSSEAFTKLQAKYPELDTLDAPPEELKESMDTLTALGGKMMSSMMKLGPYMEDAAVMEALQKMQEINL